MLEILINNFHDVRFIIDFSIALVVYITTVVFVLLKLKRRFIRYFYIVDGLLLALAMMFSLNYLFAILFTLTIISSVIFLIINITEYRYSLLNNLSSKKKNVEVEKQTTPKEQVYKTIAAAVRNLSKTKTGAILTFEKNTPLNDVIKNGTIINAPVCQELIETIFYEGTRLHDGAVVIRGDKILAASVYFEPTKRALKGKYGSRHRAAFGISEITDAVTVVVSEETGRISIAYKARMESCTLDNFYDEFVDYMNEKE